MPISKYVKEHLDTQSTMYVFDATALSRSHALKGEHVVYTGFIIIMALATCPPHEWFSGIGVLQQLMLGPRNSGAPDHFHGNAMAPCHVAHRTRPGHAANHLLHGHKQWFLVPPREASFRFQPGSSHRFACIVLHNSTISRLRVLFSTDAVTVLEWIQGHNGSVRPRLSCGECGRS